MKKLAISLVLVLAMVSTAFAAGNSETSANMNKTIITGKVIDPTTNETLAGASVIVNGKKVFTDFDGKFEIENQKDNKYEVTVSMISYQTKTLVLSSQNNQQLIIDLKR